MRKTDGQTGYTLGPEAGPRTGVRPAWLQSPRLSPGTGPKCVNSSGELFRSPALALPFGVSFRPWNHPIVNVSCYLRSSLGCLRIALGSCPEDCYSVDHFLKERCLKNERERTVESSPERAKSIFNIEYTWEKERKRLIMQSRIITENLKVIEFYGLNLDLPEITWKRSLGSSNAIWSQKLCTRIRHFGCMALPGAVTMWRTE